MKFNLEIEREENFYCRQCPCFNDDIFTSNYTFCQADENLSLLAALLDYSRPSNCPLKPVPSCASCKFWAEHRCTFRIEPDDGCPCLNYAKTIRCAANKNQEIKVCVERSVNEQVLIRPDNCPLQLPPSCNTCKHYSYTYAGGSCENIKLYENIDMLYFQPLKTFGCIFHEQGEPQI